MPSLSHSPAEPVPSAELSLPASSRDDRFDLLRGLFVFCMIVGHLGWRVLGVRFAIGWSTAAEGFFFVSGATLGLVYSRLAGSARADRLRRRLPLRGLWLYALNLTLVVVAWTLAAAPRFSAHAAARLWPGLPAWRRTLSFDHDLALNVLPRYAIFLIVAPLVLRLLEKRRGALTVTLIIVSLWATNWLFRLSLRLPELETSRVEFAVASWQLLFFGGLALAFTLRPAVVRANDRRALRTALLCASALFSALLYYWEHQVPGSANSTRGALAPWVDRTTLGPLRLLNFAIVTTLFWLAVDRWRLPITRWLGGVLLPLGRNALPAFVLHLPLLWIGASIDQVPGSWWIRRLAALAAALAISQIVRWGRLRQLLLPV